MNFKGKYEQITESTLTRFQQGGLMIGDVVKVKPNALKHPKIKDMADNVKANIENLMKSELNIRVQAIKHSAPIGAYGVSDGMGLGYGATFAPTDFWVDCAVEMAPGLKLDPISLPIEVLERQDFGDNLPPIPDALKRKGKINIKPEEVSEYDNQRGDKYSLPTKNTPLGESLEDVYAGMGEEKHNVTVRVPLPDDEKTKLVMDELGVTYSVIGPDRFELHGCIKKIEQALEMLKSCQGGDAIQPAMDIEVVDVEPAKANQPIPTPTGKPSIKEEMEEDEEEKEGNDEESLEEAYTRILNQDRNNLITISIGNAFAENVKTYLTQEGIDSKAVVNGNKTFIDIITMSDKETVEEALRANVMGDLTYLKVFDTKQ